MMAGYPHSLFHEYHPEIEEKLCFVLMPFAKEFQPIYDDHIKPTVEKAGLRCMRADDLFGPEAIIGECLMGSKDDDPDASDREKPQRRLHVEAFYIDKYPVTNEDYQRFVEETGHDQPSHWEGSTYPPGKADHPVVCVTWHDARAYAGWAGKALPTEAQWEKAARGTDGRAYPWGDKFESSKCNSWESGIEDTTPVGRYPEGASPYGVMDMAGNVWEWTSSLYKPYPYRAGDGREDAEASDARVLRGGSCHASKKGARCAWRRHDDGPDDFDYSFGFRVVVAPV